MNVIASTASYHTLVQWLMLQHNEVKQDHSVSLQQEMMDNIRGDRLELRNMCKASVSKSPIRSPPPA